MAIVHCSFYPPIGDRTLETKGGRETLSRYSLSHNEKTPPVACYLPSICSGGQMLLVPTVSLLKHYTFILGTSAILMHQPE